jgi:hypothetical protein
LGEIFFFHKKIAKVHPIFLWIRGKMLSWFCLLATIVIFFYKGFANQGGITWGC